MIKKIIIAAVLFFSLSLTSNVLAETAPVFTPFCFKSVRCDKPEAQCVRKFAHVAKLTIEAGKGPVANSKVYVVDCVSTQDGQHCTSGNAGIDNYLSYPAMPADLGYKFRGLYQADGVTRINQSTTNTLISNSSGALTTKEGIAVPAIEWWDQTKGSTHQRQFLGISETIPSVITTPALGQGGQQQAQISGFNFSAALKKCIPLAWDPDGVVFDAQSLEPIPNSIVTLTKKRLDGLFTIVSQFDPNDVPDGILDNPYTTTEDGGFSFIVADGTYKLTPKISNYVFPNVLSLNQNYTKIYTNIYPSMTGEEIIEKGGPQHRDIPVDAKSGQPTFYPIKFMEYSYQSDRISSVFVDGRVSHPMATINAYSVIPDPKNVGQVVRYKLISTIQAGKNGQFSLVINQSNFNKTKSEMFGEVEVIKADFGKSSIDTQATPAVLKLNPILTYIEGNATYQDQVLPGAKVELVLNDSMKSFYTTKADNDGYFMIPSDYIPFMPYQIRYSLNGINTTITTSKFIEENAKIFTDKKINLFYPQFTNPIVNKNIKKIISNVNSNTNNNVGTSNNTTFILLILFIITLLSLLAFVGIYLIKKKQETPGMI